MLTKKERPRRERSDAEIKHKRMPSEVNSGSKSRSQLRFALGVCRYLVSLTTHLVEETQNVLTSNWTPASRIGSHRYRRSNIQAPEEKTHQHVPHLPSYSLSHKVQLSVGWKTVKYPSPKNSSDRGDGTPMS